MYKFAALSPAIQAMQQVPSPDAKKQAFQQMVSDTAYKTFSGQFPELVENIITFRVLDLDADVGTAFGAFILDLAGQPAYVPVAMNDSELEPLEILYLKNEDRFVPLTRAWVETAQGKSSQALGESQDLPESVATDVDIRNLVVPPTTGRYSYASAQDASLGEAGRQFAYAVKIAASASYPLGQKLHKMAAAPGAPGAGSGGGSFDPAMWQGFTEQFMRMNGTTPGGALDQGQMDLDILSKMYKNHMKTWQMPAEAAAAAAAANPMGAPQDPNAAAQGAPVDPNAVVQGGTPAPAAAAAAPQTAAPGMVPPDMGKVAAQGASPSNIEQAFARLGRAVDHAGTNALYGGTAGSALGGLTAMRDDDYSDVGGRMLRGGMGGALGGVLGGAVGGKLEGRHPQHPWLSEVGTGVGALGGSLGAALPERGASPAAQLTMPDEGMYRFASEQDYEDGVLAMMKHAVAEAPARPLKLLSYLSRSPTSVKLAFSRVLQDNPNVLARAAEIYGADELLAAMRPTKTAAATEESLRRKNNKVGPQGLKIVNSKDGVKSFGDRSPLAFRGVQLRGYYFEDTRPAKNLAVQKQEYHDAQDARDPGVYKLWKTDGSQEAALVLTAPVDIMEDGRQVYPSDKGGISRVKRYAPNTKTTHPEPESVEDTRYPDPDVDRSHKVQRLVILSSGKWFITTELHGEQVTESALKGSTIAKTLFSDNKCQPKAGEGIFAYKRGAHYYGTKPVTLKDVTTSDGVISGKLGYGHRKFRMDTRSPNARLIRPRDEEFVIIPAHWKWIPLGEDMRYSDAKSDFVLSGSGVIELAMGRLGSMGAHKMVVRNTGSDSITVDGKTRVEKKAALKYLADTHEISGNDAEALLKIAELEGVCESLIVPFEAFKAIPEMAKHASAIDQAFAEILQGLQGNLEQIQGQVSVLQSVQQRAQELSGQAGQDPTAMQQTDPAMPQGSPAPAAPADPSQGAAPPAPAAQATQAPPPPSQAAQAGMVPAGGDPNAQAAPAAPAPMGAPADPNAMAQNPNAQAQTAPEPLPVMSTEGPSSTEIAQQINPTYMQQAAQLTDDGTFDAGALSSLHRAATKAMNPGAAMREGDTKDLAETVDDLGRTLLSMQTRAVELAEQLGYDGYKRLEEQVRNSFTGLGELLLELKQNTSVLNHASAA